jgi:RNA polymerase sigma-70 factor (sigma-E family)
MKTTRDEEFRSFVLTRRADLVRTATLMTAGDRHMAEDVVQATLTRLYVAWPLFLRADNQDGYARRALVNAFIDEQRRPWRRRERTSSVVPELPAADSDTGARRTEALHDALRALAPRMRAAVVYRYFHDLSVAETADALSCSQGTVKSQTARALTRLREALGDPSSATPDPSRTTATPQPLSAAVSATTITRSF